MVRPQAEREAAQMSEDRREFREAFEALFVASFASHGWAST